MPARTLLSSSSRLIVVVGLSLVLGACAGVTRHSQWGFAPGPPLSEDAALASKLRAALDGFLDSLSRGELDGAHGDEAEQRPHPFFYRSLLRGARDAGAVVLKSYPSGDGCYRITVAFQSGPPDALRLSRIVELEARPHGDSYRFACPYDQRTRSFQRRKIGSVTYRFRGRFDEARAASFVRLKERLEKLMGREPVALEYDCFDSLDALLKAFGLVHDASKCNFLLHDLGFLWDGTRRFSTGTGDLAYVFGYVRDVLTANAKDPAAVFGPYANGVAAYYGGYGLSGDSMEVLALQFREELVRRPKMDFLAEFKKGRGASIQRHFSHYVMCAFLCREIVARHGEAAALGLVECGPNGERFFAELERLLGVTEQNFHATILRLIGD